MDNFDSDKPIPLDDIDTGKQGVSHSPLDLGSSHPIEVKKVPKPQPKQAGQTITTNTQVVPVARITGMKTFFTKLHPGAIEFLNDQINEWLKKNPSIYIKQTNTCVGDLVAKSVEPNLIITVWY